MLISLFFVLLIFIYALLLFMIVNKKLTKIKFRSLTIALWLTTIALLFFASVQQIISSNVVDAVFTFASIGFFALESYIEFKYQEELHDKPKK